APGVEVRELLPDHAQRQVLVPLLAQHEPQPLEVGRAVLAVPPGRPPRLDQALLLEEAQLGRRQRREVGPEVGEHVRDAHGRLAGDTRRPGLDDARPRLGRCRRLTLGGGSGRAHDDAPAPCCPPAPGSAGPPPEASPPDRAGLGWNVIRNLPIWTSSPALSTARSMRSRLTYVPLSEPTSRTTNSSPSRTNSTCLRETVTSSRKMSASGLRPATVRSASSRNRAPALGPRWTTRRA